MSCFFSWKREGLDQLLWCEDHRRSICFHCFLVWHQQIECFRQHLLYVNQDNTGVCNLPVVQGFDDYEWVTWRTSTVASDSCEIFGVVGHGLSLDVGVVSSEFVVKDRLSPMLFSSSHMSPCVVATFHLLFVYLQMFNMSCLHLPKHSLYNCARNIMDYHQSCMVGG